MTEKPKIPYNSQMAFAIAAGRDADASRIMAEAMGEIVGKACGFAQLFDFSDLPFVVAGMRAAANILENSMDEKARCWPIISSATPDMSLWMPLN